MAKLKKNLAKFHPDQTSFVQGVLQTVFRPYFHIHGEYFLNDPEENKTRFGTKKINDYAEPIAFLYLAAYLLVANVLLLNLLIAVFGKTYEGWLYLSTLSIYYVQNIGI